MHHFGGYARIGVALACIIVPVAQALAQANKGTGSTPVEIAGNLGAVVGVVAGSYFLWRRIRKK